MWMRKAWFETIRGVLLYMIQRVECGDGHMPKYSGHPKVKGDWHDSGGGSVRASVQCEKDVTVRWQGQCPVTPAELLPDKELDVILSHQSILCSASRNDQPRIHCDDAYVNATSFKHY